MVSLHKFWLRPFALILLAAGSVSLQADTWHPLTWRGERAWLSRSGPWAAVVSEARARLVFFGEWEGEKNLLYATFPAGRAPSLGGHRFWLGPQNDWKALWPPPPDWEASPGWVRVSGNLLTLTLPHTDRDYPALTRSYRWEEKRLVCRGSWTSGGNKNYQAIQTFHLPKNAMVRARVSPGPSLPRGFAILKQREKLTLVSDFSRLPGKLREKDGWITVRRDGGEWKMAFPPQALVSQIGDSELILSRGRSTGRVVSEPDLGLLTQIYLGADKDRCPFVEIEQLSPVLEPRGNEPAAFEVSLEARKPSSGLAR